VRPRIAHTAASRQKGRERGRGGRNGGRGRRGREKEEDEETEEEEEEEGERRRGTPLVPDTVVAVCPREKVREAERRKEGKPEEYGRHWTGQEESKSKIWAYIFVS
jgi:hypothetical protein